MTQFPYMPMWWGDFFRDVDEWPIETQGIYAVLLGRMWLRGGWVPADDGKLARLLGIDVRAWRARHKPLIAAVLRREIDPDVGEIYRQRRLTAEMDKVADLIARNKARTAAATAERTKKSKKHVNVTVTAAVHRNDQRDVVRSERQRARASYSDTDTYPKGSVSESPLPPNDPAPPEDVSVARDLGIAPSTPPAPAASRKPPSAPVPTRRRNDWDLPPSPGPSGETAFLKRFAAFKAGDPSAIDPLPGVPNNNANPALAAKIRQQLGLEPREENNADPQADEDDDGLVQRSQRAPPAQWPHASEAGTPHDQTASTPGDDRAEHTDPRKPDDDDDISGLFKF